MSNTETITFSQRARLAEKQSENINKAHEERQARRERTQKSRDIADALKRQGVNLYRDFIHPDGETTMSLGMAFINDKDRTEGEYRPLFANSWLVMDVQASRQAANKAFAAYALEKVCKEDDRIFMLGVGINDLCPLDRLRSSHDALKQKVCDLKKRAWFSVEAELLFMVAEETVHFEGDEVVYHPHVHIFFRLKGKRLANGWRTGLFEYFGAYVDLKQINNLNGILNYAFKLTDYSILLNDEEELARFYKAMKGTRRFEVYGRLKEIKSDVKKSKCTPRPVFSKDGEKPRYLLQYPQSKPVKKGKQQPKFLPKAKVNGDDPVLDSLDEGLSRTPRMNILVGRCLMRSCKDGKMREFFCILNPDPKLSYEQICERARIPKQGDTTIA